MAARNPNEAMSFRLDAAVTSATATAPTSTDGSEGIPCPTMKSMRARAHLECVSGAASGTRSYRVKVFGYRSRWFTMDADGWAATAGIPAEIASTGRWFEIFDTETESNAADFNKSYLLDGAADFERLETRVWTIGGSTPTLSTAIGFAGGREQ